MKRKLMSPKSIDLKKLQVDLVSKSEEGRYKELMAGYHYLGHLPKISETLWYIGRYGETWTSLISFSASSLKCADRERWIGWDYQYRYSRLKLIVNNSRFLILPDWHHANLGSRVLSLCEKRLRRDWQRHFGHSIVLLETYIDPNRFHGGVYRASNWQAIGMTKGYRRKNGGYTKKQGTGKLLFVKPLVKQARELLSSPELDPKYRTGEVKMQLKADQMRSLPHVFREIPDPRRAQGKRHSLSTVLSLAAAAILCGMRGYKGIADWTQSLGQQARMRFGCRYDKGRYIVPSESIIRDLLVRVDPVHLDRAIRTWNAQYAADDVSLAIDGKVMRNAIDNEGKQTHIMSVIGHDTKVCYTQKKSVLSP